MKKIFFAAAIFCPALLTAQSFEGIMKFSWSYTGEQAAMLAQAMPSATTIYVKGTSTKVVSEGGMMSAMMGEVINIGSEKTTYFVMASEKSVYKVKSDEVKSKQDETATVTKESSTAIILGYKCQKYKVVTKNGTNYVWATKEIDMSGVDYKGKIGYKGVEGMIMKHEMNVVDNGKTYVITMTMTVFEKKSINDSEFKFPADYTVKEEMPSIMKLQGN